MIRPPPRSTLFPYTPLSRSRKHCASRSTCSLWPTGSTRCCPSARAGHCSRHGDVHGLARCQSTARGIHRVEPRSEEHTSELQSRQYLVCRLLLEKKKKKT